MNILLKMSVLCKMYMCRKNIPQFVEVAQKFSAPKGEKKVPKKGKPYAKWVNEIYHSDLSREK